MWNNVTVVVALDDSFHVIGKLEAKLQIERLHMIQQGNHHVIIKKKSTIQWISFYQTTCNGHREVSHQIIIYPCVYSLVITKFATIS